MHLKHKNNTQSNHTIMANSNIIANQIIVDEVPNFAGIDPFVRFIDRDTGNNIIKI